MSDHSKPSLEGQIPDGFDVRRLSEGVVEIRHKRTGMGCMNTFLFVWLFIWTIGCIFLLYQYLVGGEMDGGGPVPLWFVSVFWAAEIVVGAILTYMLFCKKVFRLDQENLTLETTLLGLKRRGVIPRGAIRRVIQVKDGGVGDDSFPSWGLKVQANKKRMLIYRQPYDKSSWLGEILAVWANVGFTAASKE